MGIYDRYLLGQIARPMLTTILIALVALLAERTLRVVDLVVGWRGSLLVIFEMLSYLVPHYMGLALPVAFFLGILLTVSRLSREGELSAMQASGVGLPGMLRPMLVMAVLLALVHTALVSHLQPFGRYAYRAAMHALTSASFETLLQDGLFTTLGNTTYMVERLSKEDGTLDRVFLHSSAPGEDALTVTAESGRVERADAFSPIRLVLKDGLQQLVPAPPEGGTASGPRELVARFREFETTFGEVDTGFRARGEDERELTLIELWRAYLDPPEHIDPWEIEAELHGRVVRILSLPLLPLMAIPLALGRMRGQRSYGLVIGLAALIAYHHALQLGEALVDNDRAPAWLGLWVPFGVFAAWSIFLFRRNATRVPDPQLAYWIDRQLDRLRALLPVRAAPGRQG